MSIESFFKSLNRPVREDSNYYALCKKCNTTTMHTPQGCLRCQQHLEKMIEAVPEGQHVCVYPTCPKFLVYPPPLHAHNKHICGACECRLQLPSVLKKQF